MFILSKIIESEKIKYQKAMVNDFSIFAPGRMNLIGEHTDYNGGMVLPFAIDKGITIRVGYVPRGLCGDASVRSIVSSDFSPTALWIKDGFMDKVDSSWSVELFKENVPTSISTSWARYIVGAFFRFYKHSSLNLPEDMTLWLHLESNLPSGGGLSSSAALSTGVLSALCWSSGKGVWSAEKISYEAMLVEHQFAGTKCGLMDQLAVTTSRQDNLTCINFLDFPKDKSFAVRNVPMHNIYKDYRILAFNTQVAHSLSDSAYNERRSVCEKSVEFLNQKLDLSMHSVSEFLSDKNKESIFKDFNIEEEEQVSFFNYLKSFFSSLGSSSADIIAQRVSHVLCENKRVEKSVKALQGGDIKALHSALLESHNSLKDYYEVSCYELDIACSSVTNFIKKEYSQDEKFKEAIPLIGPRMTGAGFGGSTIQLIHKDLVLDVLEYFECPENEYTQKTGLLPKLFVTTPCKGIHAFLRG